MLLITESVDEYRSRAMEPYTRLTCELARYLGPTITELAFGSEICTLWRGLSQSILSAKASCQYNRLCPITPTVILAASCSPSIARVAGRPQKLSNASR